MKQFKQFIIYLVLTSSASLYAQQPENLKVTLIDHTDPKSWLYLTPSAPPGIRGSQYLFEDWKLITITLRDSSVHSNVMANYNLLDQELEIANQKGIKIVPKGFIISWKIQNEDTPMFFYAPNDVKSCLPDKAAYVQFMAGNEKLTLLKFHSVEKKDPSYNEKLGIGDHNFKLFKEEHWFILDRKKCYKLDGNYSRRMEVLRSLSSGRDIHRLVEENNLNLKNETDLVALFNDVTERN